MAKEDKTKNRNKQQGSKRETGKDRGSEKKNPRTPDKITVQSRVYEAIKFDASNIYFNNLVGSNIERTTGLNVTRLPGILIFRSAPNFVSNSDMLNVAATSIYTYVRHANSGRTNYEASDLMVYLIAMSEIYVAIAELTRAYGIASYFTSQNLYSGHILEALGFEPIQTRNQLADMRYSLNVLINKVKAFAVPKAFNYFDERISEHLNVYSDEPGDRGQFMAIVPGTRGVFNATREGGSSIDFVEVPSVRNVFDYIATINDVVEDLRANEDINIMSGDIMKAYGDNLYTPQPVPVDLITAPIYDELQLLQFQNGHFPGDIHVSPLIQTNNRLGSSIQITSAVDSINYTDKRYLNSPYEGVDANLIFALSKYQITTKTIPGETQIMDLVSANTTILYGMTLFILDESGREVEAENIDQYHASAGIESDFIYLSKFKHHPYIYFEGYSLPVGDMHYVALLSETDTNRMNDARFILAFQTDRKSVV